MELHKKFYIETGKMHRSFVAEGSSVGKSFWYNSNDYVEWLEERLNKVNRPDALKCGICGKKTALVCTECAKDING